jgi:hypothetical protein
MNNQTTNTVPFIGLCEMENIITVVANGWDEKIIAAKDMITEFLGETDKNIVAVTKDPTSEGKVKKFFPTERVVMANMKNNIEPLKDLNNAYALVVVDSALFNDYTKYLMSIQAKDNGLRLAFIS